jgi:hypothetical protein
MRIEFPATAAVLTAYPVIPMKLLTALVMFSVSGACMAAELYKWVDEKGVTTYGQKPPANRAATPVDTSPSGVIETGGQFDRKISADRPLRPAESQAAPPPAPASAAARGMEFDVYSRLQRGMTEGELLQRAGKPDHESLDGLRRDIVKTFYYFPTSSNPYTTVVTLRGGRIDEIDRVKKF